MRRTIGLLVSLIIAINSWSLTVPHSSGLDTRIQTARYRSSEVFLIRAQVGLGSRIVFGKNETILEVASGFSQGWEFSNRRNILYIKPKSIKQGEKTTIEPSSPDWNTNLMVTTNQHLYDFDVKLLTESAYDNHQDKSKDVVSYRVTFDYPETEKAEHRAKVRQDTIKRRLNRRFQPLNTHYSMQVGGQSHHIAPIKAYDDGRFTYLTFASNQNFPAAFLWSATGQESLVNSHIDPIRPNTLVIHRVSPRLLLRLGRAIVGVYNDHFNGVSVETHQGTTVPGIIRTVKQGSSL